MRERTGRKVDGNEVLEEKEKVEIWADAAEWDFVSTDAFDHVHTPFRLFYFSPLYIYKCLTCCFAVYMLTVVSPYSLSMRFPRSIETAKHQSA
jgi:hypothetical protein